VLSGLGSSGTLDKVARRRKEPLSLRRVCVIELSITGLVLDMLLVAALRAERLEACNGSIRHRFCSDMVQVESEDTERASI
jgi:hypothetical protein